MGGTFAFSRAAMLPIFWRQNEDKLETVVVSPVARFPYATNQRALDLCCVFDAAFGSLGTEGE